MAAISPPLKRGAQESALFYGPLVLGLLVMYVPSYLDASQRFWARDQETHGPVILAVVLWLLWRDRDSFNGVPTVRERWLGVVLLSVGLILYVIGRSQEFFQFDIGSQIPVLIGLSVLLGGRQAFMRTWFPAGFLLFLVPIPPSLTDQILVPLKVVVSQMVTDGLFSLGLPISRTGVVLTIGQYQLLIADACSGLRSMVALTGIGLLYVYIIGNTSRTIKVLLLAAAIPIAFVSNVLRVTALVLITYYFGDEAGTRFHDIAGYFELVLAFGAFFGLDFLLSQIPALRSPFPA